MFTGKRPTDDMFKDSLNLHNFVRMALPHQVANVADPMLFQGGEEETSTWNLRNRSCARVAEREDEHQCSCSLVAFHEEHFPWNYAFEN
ncbi:hypothetical protein ACSBR2_007766 [Camellia fascicularis]